MHMLFYLGIILISGLLMGKLVSYIRLPKVTGYLLAGVIIGTSFLNLVPSTISGNFDIIADAALGFIAFSIGSEFEFNSIKKLGLGIFIITLFEALGAVIVVFLVLKFILHAPTEFSIVLASIAAATAPAATLMVIKQYKAKGPLVNTLLPIVALDDAIGIIIFGVSLEIAKSLSLSTNSAFSIKSAIFMPILDLGLAIIIGFVVGFLISYLSKKASGPDQLLTIILASIFFTIGLVNSIGVSSLLTCMTVGATITNIAPNSKRVFSIIERFTPPIYMAFFTVAGIELDLGLLRHVGLYGIAYIFARVIGKSFGAYFGSKIAKCPSCVQKYLGFTLVPQAGVAIGLAMIAEISLPEYGASIRTIILSATVIYELIGPLLTKTALVKAGEIKTTLPISTQPKTHTV